MPSMWPKALAQLIELAPHIARLLPTADRFLQSKVAGDEATRAALAKFGDEIRADIEAAGWDVRDDPSGASLLVPR